MSQCPSEAIHYDVIIAGGGPSGCTAAAAAAREGRKTLLLEGTGALGGMGTSGLVTCWCPFTDKENIIYGGLAYDVFKASIDQQIGRKEDNIHGHQPFDPEQVKRIYDNLVINAGADILFYSLVCDVFFKDDRHLGAIAVATKAGLQTYSADVFIDATGNADLSHLSGLETRNAKQEGAAVMPSTHCFMVSNVNEEAYHAGPYSWCGAEENPIWDILKSGKYPEIESFHVTTTRVGPGIIGFNAGHLYDVDATDPRSVSAAMIKGRQVADAIHRALREYAPAAFEESHLSVTANLLGVRESRRIIGETTITSDDYYARRSFDDEIGRNCYYVDTHQGKNDIRGIDTHEKFVQHMGALTNSSDPAFKAYGPGESHGIPFRALIPKGVSNLLVAGRSISADRMAMSSLRVMPPCMVMGEAAGVAAGMISRHGLDDVRELNIPELRQTLKNHGGIFK